MAATTHLQPTARLRGGVEEEEEVIDSSTYKIPHHYLPLGVDEGRKLRILQNRENGRGISSESGRSFAQKATWQYRYPPA